MRCLGALPESPITSCYRQGRLRAPAEYQGWDYYPLYMVAELKVPKSPRLLSQLIHLAPVW